MLIIKRVMMEKHIEARILLQAADKIRQHGQKRELDYLLEGTSLMISPDEYTIELRSSKVSLSFYFHNKFKVDAKKERDLEDFYKILERISLSEY
tara:strand:- start:1450 stop:1734 length:285 start_codon:yes stop_codon:yes gene_type:complete